MPLGRRREDPVHLARGLVSAGHAGDEQRRAEAAAQQVDREVDVRGVHGRQRVVHQVDVVPARRHARLDAFAAREDRPDQPARRRAADPARDQREEDPVVDAREEFRNVPLEDIRVRADEGLASAERAVCTPSYPIRERVRQEHAVEQRLDHAAERVVNHAVGKRRRADLALDGFPDDEVTVRAGTVGLVP
jgi:hypothetical protein